MVADEESLVRCCLAGEQKAYQNLVERYQKKLFSVAYGMVHHAEDSLDLVQEAFLKGYCNLSKFQGQSSFYTWIYRILVNLCIDFLRKEKRLVVEDFDDTIQHRAEQENMFPHIRPHSHNPYQAISNKELGEHIWSAIQTLSDNHRLVIVLREIEGLSYEEIAQAIGCSKGTVMSRLHHARARLRQALIDYISSDQSPSTSGPNKPAKSAAC